LVLPIPVLTLIYFASKPDVMGLLVNRRYVTLTASACAVLIVVLNLLLIYQTLGGTVP
jgi:manganese transport protein